MPHIETEETVPGYAFCQQFTDPEQSEECPGYEEQPVAVVRTVWAWTYGDGGAVFEDGVDPGRIEKTIERVAFAHATDEPCPHCGAPRVPTVEKRPVYARLSHQDPRTLLRQRKVQVQAVVAQTEQNTLLARLVEQNAELLRMVVANGNGLADEAPGEPDAPAEPAPTRKGKAS